MKLEYIADTDSDFLCKQLIRLVHFSVSDISKLMKCLEELLENEESRFSLSDKKIIQKDEIDLIFNFHSNPKGLRRISNSQFDCSLNKTELKEVLEKLSYFLNPKADGFHWLFEPSNEDGIEFLVSYGGSW